MEEPPRKRLDAATERLRSLVGDYPPGARLPTERQLTEELGIGRSTLREAVSRLVALGLVEVVHGRGMFAADGSAVPTTPAPSADDLEGLLGAAARAARARDLEVEGFLGRAKAAYESEAEAAHLATVTIVTPLPSALRSELVALLDATGREFVESPLDGVEADPRGAVLVLWHAVGQLAGNGQATVLSLGATLCADLTIGLGTLGSRGEVSVAASDEETLAAVLEAVRAMRPDLRVNGWVGAQPPEGESGRPLLVEDRLLEAIPEHGIPFRTDLGPAERKAIERALAQPRESESAGGRATRASSRMGMASSQALD
jgi:DNA-binding transcriptional regulator YhcF (GntR family)